MQSDTLTYASPRDPRWKRWTTRVIEDLSGRRGLLPVYYRWRTEVAGKSPRMMGELLDMVGHPARHQRRRMADRGAVRKSAGDRGQPPLRHR
jgi:hypothetical protein